MMHQNIALETTRGNIEFRGPAIVIVNPTNGRALFATCGALPPEAELIDLDRWRARRLPVVTRMGRYSRRAA